jgi:hypothetical protein
VKKHGDPLDRITSLARESGCEIHPFIRPPEGKISLSETRLPTQSKQQVKVSDATWSCRIESKHCDAQTVELEILFQVLNGATSSAVVGLVLDFNAWSPSNYVFMPAAVYQGNDFAVLPLPYPPMWRDEADFRDDMPVTVTDVQRLARESPRIELNTGDLATPCMGFYSGNECRGALMFTEQETRLGNSGMTVALLDDGRTASFSITAPSVREFRQHLCGRVQSDDQPGSWKAGDELRLRVVIRFFVSDTLQGLFDHFCNLRKTLHAPSAAHCLPFAAALRMIEEKYNLENWDEARGYYQVAPDSHTTFETANDPLCFLWQLGWVGGGQATLPLMSAGCETSRQRAWRNLEMIFRCTQAESGFFCGIGDGENFFGDGFDLPWPHDMHMIRKSADWLFFSIKHFDLVEKLGQAVPVEWDESIRRLADAFVKLWQQHRQFGQIVNVRTGSLMIGGSCAGAIAPAGLLMAANRYDQRIYQEVAVAAAMMYYNDYVSNGITNGGPGEILSAPDSESAFALMESFVALMEHDGDSLWRDAARETLRLAATWVVSYDYQFPQQSDLAKSGARTTGAVWANVQNKHAAPGICTLSGEALLRYWRRTGDPLALDLLHDIAHGIPQYLSREDRPLNDRMKPGWMCERVNLSDWEGAEGVGGKLFGSCWPEVSMMLTAIEIPGIYVQPDTGFVHVFDHVICNEVIHANGSLRVKLTNPTAYDAELKVLSESSSNCAIPLGLNPLHSSKRILVPAGASIEVEFHS